MRRSVNAFLLFSAVVIFLLIVLVLKPSVPNTPSTAYQSDSEGNPFKTLSLQKPPAMAIGATASTPPLNTSAISLIAYYHQVGGWTLADTVPAFISYLDGGNYYDGLVRVWDSGVIGAVSSDSSDAYIDVNVRVRADGWILAWFNRSDDPGSIVWWGHDRVQTGQPPSYSTTLSRSIEIVFVVAGSVAFPGYNIIGMYDYSEPASTRLLIFGHSVYAQNATYYYTIPANSTIVPTKLLIRSGGGGLYSADYPKASLSVDGVIVYQRWNNIWGWSTFEIDNYAKGIQHSVVQTAPYYSVQYVGFFGAYHNVAFIMWSG